MAMTNQTAPEALDSAELEPDYLRIKTSIYADKLAAIRALNCTLKDYEMCKLEEVRVRLPENYHGVYDLTVWIRLTPGGRTYGWLESEITSLVAALTEDMGEVRLIHGGESDPWEI
jgi:hypothetical protein